MESAKQPRFSVIVPTFNRNGKVALLVRALREQSTSPDDFEIIIVDDGSTIPVEADGATVLRQDNRGPAAARNLGASRAQGEYLVFTDDDCLPGPNWLLSFSLAIDKHPHALLAGSVQNARPENAAATFNQELADYLTQSTKDTPQAFATSNNLCVPASLFQDLGGFSEHFAEAAGEDRDFCHRLNAAGHELIFVADAVVEHEHPQSLWQFWRMHTRYGRGARQLAAKPGLNRLALIRWGLQSHPGWFVLSQLAVTLGFYSRELQTLWRYAVCSLAAAFALLLCLASLGAFSGEFGGDDEVAHLVSGIMVAQYLTQGIWQGQGPLGFAEAYYDSYPKVAIGHWPPLFYLLQGLWYPLAGLSRFSVMLLAALIGGCFAALITLFQRPSPTDWPLALFCTLVVALLPQTIHSTIEFSSDPLTALLALLATWACQSWLMSASLASGLGFAFAATAGALTKGNAFPVWLLPSLFLLRPFPKQKLLRPAFWLPLLLMLLITGAWYLNFPEIAQAEIVPGKTANLSLRMWNSFQKNCWHLLWLVSPAALLGILLVFLKAEGRAWLKENLALACLPIAFLVFLSFLSPHTESRLMLAAAPALLSVAVEGARNWHRLAPFPLLAVCLFWTHQHATFPMKPSSGHIEAAAWLAQQEPAVLLAAGNEGALIAELAILQPMPRHRVLRGSKLLQSSTWMGGNLRLMANSPEDVAKLLANHEVRYVVTWSSPKLSRLARPEHLEAAIEAWPGKRHFGEVIIRFP